MNKVDPALKIDFLSPQQQNRFLESPGRSPESNLRCIFLREYALIELLYHKWAI